VDPISGKTTLISLVKIKRELEGLLGVTTDVLTPIGFEVHPLVLPTASAKTAIRAKIRA